MQRSLTPAAARRAVENAVSAVVEQLAAGNARNPGGMLVDALRRGYTANAAKRSTRQNTHSESQSAANLEAPQPVQPSTPPTPVPQPPNSVEISLAIDLALRDGDRPFALGKLQRLWLEGWHDLVAELCKLRREWGFTVGDRGPIEA
ncbi:hypothetical protein HC928_20520 [bacterium]|nr:hypothetical protein [bacterium]